MFTETREKGKEDDTGKDYIDKDIGDEYWEI
jgi:hypothetical protein